MTSLGRRLFSDPAERSIVSRVFRENARQYRGLYVAAGLCLVFLAASTAYAAHLMAPIVDEAFIGADASAARWYAVVVGLLFIARGFATYFQTVLLSKIGNNIVARYQRRIFSHLLSLGVGYFQSTHSAYLVGRINQNVLGVRDLLNTVVLAALRDLLTLVGLVAVMVWYDPIMAAAMFTLGPLVLGLLNRYARRVKGIARQEVDLNARVTLAVQETAAGMPIVKAFTMEERLAARMEALTAQAEERANKIARISARTSPLMETFAGLTVAAVVAYGSWQVAENGYAVGNLTAFMTALLMAYEPAKRLARLKVVLERSYVNARMIYEILDEEPALCDAPDAEPLVLDEGEVRFEDVAFSYPGTDEPVIDGLSFVAPAGRTTALVGPSGGGKSTTIALLQRFFALDGGRILVDGQDIARTTTRSLRAHVAYVSQQPVLFDGTVRENLAFARPSATETEIVEAAREAQAHDFISRLPQGYDTPLGENGTNLSGGQRQRLSIARAILRDAPILLLDEATSALDNTSEARVQEALERVMRGRTVIVVAHRLSTIRNADRIVVIEGGRAVDEGDHASLLERGGTYARFQTVAGGLDGTPGGAPEKEKGHG